MEKAIIVLGMHRSGTSMVAELAHRWGAFAGDESQLLPANQWNESGYWEHRPLVDLNDQLLGSLETSWLVPPLLEDEGRLVARSSEAEFHDSALRSMREMASRVDGLSCWFWKDPRLAIVLPFWKEFLKDPIYLIVVRNPLDVAHSLRGIFHFPLSAALLLWQRYLLSILKNTAYSKRVLYIEYEQVLQDPRQQCERISDFLDKQSGKTQREIDVLEGLMRVVKPSLRHRTSREFGEVDLASREQKELYELLRRRVDDPSAKFDQIACGLYPGWREYLQTIDLLRRHWMQFPQLVEPLINKTQGAYAESDRRLLGFETSLPKGSLDEPNN